MASYNKVIIAGNLTADPELKYLTKGTAVAQFNVAVNRKWKDESGQQKEEVTFVGVKAWGKQAETICQYLKKGRPILIEGRLTQESWDDKATNQKRSKTLVTLESFQFLDSNNAGDGSSSERPPSRPPTAGVPTRANSPAPAASGETPPEEDPDIPF